MVTIVDYSDSESVDDEEEYFDTYQNFFDIECDYDESADDDDNVDDASDDTADENEAGSIMMACLNRIQQQLRQELQDYRQPRSKRDPNNWLIHELRDTNFYLRRENFEDYCELLGIKFQEAGYYRDVFVWLPDLQYGKRYMPACINCYTSKDVKGPSM